MFSYLVNIPVHVLNEGNTALSELLADATTILTSIITNATSITTWILGNPMARLFLAIMLLMLALHFVKSFIRTA